MCGARERNQKQVTHSRVYEWFILFTVPPFIIFLRLGSAERKLVYFCFCMPDEKSILSM
jgi:hypothetical protein